MNVNKLSDFMALVRNAVNTTYGSGTIGFVAAYPAGQQNFPLITYKLVSSKPSSFGRDREIKPRLRDTQQVDRSYVDFYAQRVDHIINFEIWAADGKTADEVVETFEDLIAEHTGEFKEAGVVEIIWLGQQNDKQTARWSVDLMNRTVSYLIVLDRTTIVKHGAVNDIDINADVYDN